IILRDFWCDILRVRASKDLRWMNWLASPRRLANMRFSILNWHALPLKMVARAPRLLGKSRETVLSALISRNCRLFGSSATCGIGKPGGTSVDPTQYMTSVTPFNSDLFAAPHQLIADS